ncbi:MAG: mechanosensitive ion channel domain-containing protein [Elusimicrobiota bacterium]
MRRAKAILAIVLCASLVAPASAQMRAAAALEGAVPRVTLSAPLIAPSFQGAPSLTLFSAPSAPIAAPSAAPLPAMAPAAASLPAAAASAPAGLPAAAPVLPVSRALSAARAVLPAASAKSAPAVSNEESGRLESEKFWSGASDKTRDEFPAVEASASASPAAPLHPSRAAVSRTVLGAVAVAVPAAHGFAGFLSHASPFLEAGAVLAGTYVANRAVHALLSAFGSKRGMDRHQVAAIRLVSSVVLWTAATAAALKLGGASPQLMTTVFGAGGTILTLGLKDVLGNVIQGVNFLVTRPYTIGAKVLIDEQVGTVSDVTLTSVKLRKDDGSEVLIRHAALAAKPVIVYGAYQFPDAALHLSDAKIHLALPAKPKFQGALGAVWKSLDRRFWIAGAAFGALLAAPAFLPVLTAGWAAAVVHYGLAGSIAWLTRRVDVALGSAIDALALQNGWRPETRVITRLASSAALWALGGGAVLRLIGVSWTALGASIGLTTLGVGLASNNFFGSVVQGGEVLFSKPFKVGDRVKIGTFEGTVEDMTLYHVVIKLDEERHALVPYAVVRDATLVVEPGQK